MHICITDDIHDVYGGRFSTPHTSMYTGVKQVSICCFCLYTNIYIYILYVNIYASLMNTLLFHAILIPLCTCPLLDACSARAFVGGVVFFLNPNPFVYLLLRVRSMFVYLLLEKHVRVLARRDTHVQHVLFVGGFFLIP